MSEEYTDNLKAKIVAAILGWLDEHPRLNALEVEDAIPFETPAEIRKAVLLSLQKQGLIRMRGDRRTSYYEAVLRRKSVLKVDNQTLLLLIRLYGPGGTRTILHKMDAALFPAEDPATSPDSFF